MCQCLRLVWCLISRNCWLESLHFVICNLNTSKPRPGLVQDSRVSQESAAAAAKECQSVAAQCKDKDTFILKHGTFHPTFPSKPYDHRTINDRYWSLALLRLCLMAAWCQIWEGRTPAGNWVLSSHHTQKELSANCGNPDPDKTFIGFLYLIR